MSDKHEWKVGYTDGKVSIRSDDFTHDAVLYLTGDFATHEVAIGYAARLAARLNADPTASALRQVEREMLERAAKVCEELEYPTALDEWMRMTKKEHNVNACRQCAAAIRALSPTPTPTELLTTQELADVSTPVKLIDRDQSDGYVRVPRNAIVATSAEADFSKGTWTFEPKGEWSVMAGDYYLIPVKP